MTLNFLVPIKVKRNYLNTTQSFAKLWVQPSGIFQLKSTFARHYSPFTYHYALNALIGYSISTFQPNSSHTGLNSAGRITSSAWKSLNFPIQRFTFNFRLKSSNTMSDIVFTPPRVFNEVFPSVVPCERNSNENGWSQFQPTSERPLIIGTHSGTFHCDEVVATMLLTLLYGSENVVIIRTRNPEFLERCQIVVDVGAKYNVENNRFDHHQREFSEVFGDNFKTRLSSAGLVWKHFGKDLLMNVYGLEETYANRFYTKFYVNFFEHIDAIDNGIEVADGELKYKITTTLSSRISYANPSWKETNPDYSAYFKKAMKIVYKDFSRSTNYFIFEWLDCRNDVVTAFNARKSIDESGEIIRFDTFCPWKEHLLEIEKENDCEGQIKYALFQDQSGKWRIQCVPQASGSFESRKPLPSAWRGIRDGELDKILNTEGAIFVHAAGFIGGHNTYEGVLRMARMALETTE